MGLGSGSCHLAHQEELLSAKPSGQFPEANLNQRCLLNADWYSVHIVFILTMREALCMYALAEQGPAHSHHYNTCEVVTLVESLLPLGAVLRGSSAGLVLTTPRLDGWLSG